MDVPERINGHRVQLWSPHCLLLMYGVNLHHDLWELTRCVHGLQYAASEVWFRRVYKTLHFSFMQDHDTILGSEIWSWLGRQMCLGRSCGSFEISNCLFTGCSCKTSLCSWYGAGRNSAGGISTGPNKIGSFCAFWGFRFGIPSADEFQPLDMDEQSSPVFGEGHIFDPPAKNASPETFGSSDWSVVREDDLHQLGRKQTVSTILGWKLWTWPMRIMHLQLHQGRRKMQRS